MAPARSRSPARHEEPTADALALEAARRCELMLAEARLRGLDRWMTYLAPLPDRLRDDPLPALRGAARRLRSAYGPQDSIRDVLPPEVTEPTLDAVDRLLRELDRIAAQPAGH